ncbi:hypothetical protein [Amycolatopsis plumensis]|uniref:Uncharacterized protein n=1 Tax=Amycolatopsis plumensis TaxID=236508 RepID=A0ABV5UBS0_9PSEU
MSEGRWRRERSTVLEWRDEWLPALAAAGPVSIEVDPAAAPAPGTSWNWWLSFSVGELSIEAIVAEGLDAVVFEDEHGRFEDQVAPDGVPGYLLGRSARS